MNDPISLLKQWVVHYEDSHHDHDVVERAELVRQTKELLLVWTSSLSGADIDDLVVIRQKLWQAVATLTTIDSKDFRQRMRGADSQVRSALEHIERISRRTKAED